MRFYTFRSKGGSEVEITSKGLLSRIQPNMKKKHTSSKIGLAIGGTLFGINFIAFAVSICLISKIESEFLSVFLVFIGIAIVATLISGIFWIKLAHTSVIVKLMNEIMKHEKFIIDDLDPTREIGKNSVAEIIDKLIKTENLKEYGLIENIGVAKVGSGITAKDFLPIQHLTAIVDEVTKRKLNSKCPSCGSSITKETSNFCDYCGLKLY